jgi:hypothetical protein
VGWLKDEFRFEEFNTDRAAAFNYSAAASIIRF